MKTSGLADSPFFIEQSHHIKKARNHHNDSPAGKKVIHPDDRIAIITKSMREVGKEGCTYRLTKREKTALIEIIYNFRMRSIRVSENEIVRIAINFLIKDFQGNKTQSFLGRIIEFMHS